MTRDVKRLVAALEAVGAEVTLGRAGHLRVRHPSAHRLVWLPSTPSDRRWMANKISEMRSAGIPPVRL
ncbi:hypothetical protein GCM10017562_59930 [Streptomyces roseofulvus]|uniref:hypothetical protein n=1 Tax=Streptomyces roseofulvus TaxID=33902 RepID=UPI0031FE1413